MPARLFAGEAVEASNGPAVLVKYVPGDPKRPLVVLIPGGFHLGRVFYGGHAGSHPQDFLVHWLSQFGYGSLTISYPAEVVEGFVPDDATRVPHYNKDDWGRQACAITRQYVGHHSLSNKVVLAGWSIAGRIVEPFGRFSRTAPALDVELFISLAATPPIAGLSSAALYRGMPTKPATASKSGYLHVPDMLDMFYREVEVQGDINGRPIMDSSTYKSLYTCGQAAPMLSAGIKFDEESGNFVQDLVHVGHGPYAFENLPLIAAVFPDGPLDMTHSLVDKYVWSFIGVNKLAVDLNMARPSWLGQDRQRWEQLSELIRAYPNRVKARKVGETHFFFLGERGARETAAAIHDLILEVAVFRLDLEAALSDGGGRSDLTMFSDSSSKN